MILHMIVLEPNYHSAFLDGIIVANLVKITVMNEHQDQSIGLVYEEESDLIPNF